MRTAPFVPHDLTKSLFISLMFLNPKIIFLSSFSSVLFFKSNYFSYWLPLPFWTLLALIISLLASKKMAALQICAVSRFISTKITRKQNSTLKEELKTTVVQWCSEIRFCNSISLSSKQENRIQIIRKDTKNRYSR